MQFAGVNYLMPVDAKLNDEADFAAWLASRIFLLTFSRPRIYESSCSMPAVTIPSLNN
jgi:hypothetical protein